MSCVQDGEMWAGLVIMRDRDKVSLGKGEEDGCNMACTGISRDTECSVGAGWLH